ncbi:MAG TPA: hypothetical protein VFS08_10335 [Gemmatimonadaceae bacterium]|nr:hypothetical protein [Gemmatimonadaceae bacterium]
MSRPLVDFAPAASPLLRDPPLDHVTELPVLGIATRFATNSRYVRELVEETFGGWRCVADDADASPGAQVRIVVHEGDEGDEGEEHGAGHAPVRHICPDATRVIAHSPGSVAISDPARAEAVAYVTTALAADRAHFRDAMLEAITLALLSHFDRHPVHAAAVARDGHAVLLAGPSGSGKSTLACLAHAAGFHVLGDDRVWVQLAPRRRVWGWPGRARLLPDAAAHLPELARLGAPDETDGKGKLAVTLGGAPGAARYVAERATVCLLVRAQGRAGLQRLAPAEVADVLARRPDPGFDRFPGRHEAVVRTLAAHGGWRLALSDDPREALPLLQRMLDD